VVVTTNVQFFESLFSNQPGRCRKVHTVARSVVVLDECQSLPPGLVAPTCGMLKQLTTQLGCTVVLCTATQPAFDHDALKPADQIGAGEIIPADLNLFDRLKRVTVTWPKKGEAKLSWADVAAMVAAEPQALCVVNTKKAAKAVYDAPAVDGKASLRLFHLSTAMCPQHRREKLARIRGLLAADAPCRVVSTQLIKAGVDVDFPFLMRQTGPLEAVIQAAGRCTGRAGGAPAAGGWWCSAASTRS
jgi:CRISPR-associated endonuclease/helicase Cas3